ncbi:hypothetical protein QUB33_06745 [Microcoleus sp. B3-A4]
MRSRGCVGQSVGVSPHPEQAGDAIGRRPTAAVTDGGYTAG